MSNLSKILDPVIQELHTPSAGLIKKTFAAFGFKVLSLILQGNKTYCR